MGIPAWSNGFGKTVSPQEYPMYCMHVSDFLDLEELKPHQDLLAAGRLRRIVADDDDNDDTAPPVIFLSHQWLGAGHPDESLRQIGVMQRVLRRMTSGKVPDIEIHYAHQILYPGHRERLSREEMRQLGTNSLIWYDFISVPQPGYDDAGEVKHDGDGRKKKSSSDHRVHGRGGSLLGDLHRAVRSIPAYMERSSHMIVLAPSCRRSDDPDRTCDLRSWRRRGWCMMELQCRLLSPHGDAKVVVVQGAESTPWLILPLEASRMRVGVGDFSCETDREELGPVLRQLIRGKIDRLAARGAAFEHNYLNAIAARILEGCGGAGGSSRRRSWTGEEIGAVDAPLLPDNESAELGWTALRFAVIRQDAGQVYRLLMDGGADLEAPLRRDFPDQFRKKGMTILHDAMFSSTPEVVEILLNAGVDCDAKDAQGQDALIWAVTGGNPNNVQFWLDRFPKWDLTTADSTVGNNALLWCFYYLHESVGLPIARRLLDAGADPHIVGAAGGTILHFAAGSDDSSLGMVRLALEYQNVNHQLRPVSWLWVFMYWLFKMAVWLGVRKKFVEVFGHSPGMTALHNAAMFGNVPVVQALLKAGADPSMRTDLGLTPLDISHIFGPFPVIEELLCTTP